MSRECVLFVPVTLHNNEVDGKNNVVLFLVEEMAMDKTTC
jgi:hypothetical protein